MIEDALKVTRNLQRLLLVACVVGIVFLASLRDVRREQRFLEALRHVPMVFNDAAYEQWVKRRSGVFVGPRSDDLEELMDRLRLWVSREVDVTALSQVLAAPDHVSRALLPQVALQEHSLPDLERMMTDVDPYKDARIVLPATGGDLLERLVEAITDVTPDSQASIRNARLHLLEPPSGDQPPHTYLDRAAESMPLELYFEMYSPGRSAPTRTLQIEASWYDLPDSSVTNWWASQGWSEVSWFLVYQAHSLVVPQDPSNSIAEVRDELERRVATAQAANRTIDFAGISIPGSLALFGIPAFLLGFAGSLLIHLRHLHRLAADHRQTFRHFSWTPVSAGDLWLWETTVLLLVLPVAVHLLLIYRAPAFGGPVLLPVIAGFVGAVGSALAGVALLRSIARLRRRLFLR